MNSFSVVESYRSLLRIGASFDKTGVDCSLFNVDVLDPKLRLLASSCPTGTRIIVRVLYNVTYTIVFGFKMINLPFPAGTGVGKVVFLLDVGVCVSPSCGGCSVGSCFE